MAIETPQDLDLGIALSAAAEALRAAARELEQIESIPMPPPDWLTKALDQHAAMSETMVLVQRKTDVDVKAIYREVMADKKWNGPQLSTLPVDEEVKQQIGDALELLRRAHLVSPHVREVLDGLPGGW